MSRDNDTVTCTFSIGKELYKEYEEIVRGYGESVNDNIISYMQNVVRYETPNAETIEAMEEVERIRKSPYKKTYASFAEILKEIADEEV